MIGYSETSVFSMKTLAIFNRAIKMVDQVDHRKLPREVRCHELARAVGQVLKLPVVDGKYEIIDHSWLMLPRDPNGASNVLDPYAVGRLPQVQLVYCSYLVHNRSYVAGDPRTDIDAEMVELLVKQLRRSPSSLSSPI